MHYDLIDSLLLEAKANEFKSSVGVVQCGERWLLGLSTAGDDRHNKWVFPGGHIKPGESPSRAAVREVMEETGVRCRAVGDIIIVKNRPNVAFVHCKVAKLDSNLDNNNEFTALGWFKISEMKGLHLYHNVRYLIDRIKRR